MPSSLVSPGRLASALMFSAALAGCAAPDIGERPDLGAGETVAASRSFADAGSPSATLEEDWWRAFGDPQLNRLIDQALARSPTLAVAAARIAQADAAAGRQAAADRPSASVGGAVQEVRQSLNNGFPPAFKAFLPQGWHDEARVSASVSYELDFFGRNRAALAAATSAADATRADAAAARLTLSTAVAGAYATLAQLYADHDTVRDAIAERGQSAALQQQRFRQGLESRQPAARAEADLAASRADLAQIEGRIALVSNLLAALVGKGPDRGLEIERPAQGIKRFAAPAVLPADLVGRRPDVAAARARAQAAASREDRARADFYPNVNLAAAYGLQSLPISLLAQGDSQFGSVGPAISLPVFDAGAREATYRGSRAAYLEAAAVYQQTIVQAFREVADALAQSRSLGEELTQAKAEVRACEEARTLADQRYRAGLERYFVVLDAQDKLIVARRRVADLEAGAFNIDIALIRALGGGYRAAS